MSAIRDHKRKARRDLHANASVPAFYLEGGRGSPAYEADVRVQNKPSQVGALGHSGLGSGNGAYAETEDTRPQIRFIRSEIPKGIPQRNAIISVEPGEAYRVDHALAPDDEFIGAIVVALSAKDAEGLPVPLARNGC